ncbi:MAG: N-acetyltransferase [Candidatus Omnitrophota bacterium]|jgi:amino-acid N-acetyltransferase|nr:MAG: N-acetyltransferase [Candidatus Omnitrophota bacterium]
MGIRKAQITDVRRIKQLIEDHMHEGFMLPRPLSELYENMRDFYVWEEEEMIHGCVGLHIVWDNLAEIKSLVVDHFGRGKGWGKELVHHCLEEAQDLHIPRVFALTKIPDFFVKLGFELVDKDQLPHKVWSECIRCPKFPGCDEVAVGIWVCAPCEIPIPKTADNALALSRV